MQGQAQRPGIPAWGLLIGDALPGNQPRKMDSSFLDLINVGWLPTCRKALSHGIHAPKFGPTTDNALCNLEENLAARTPDIGRTGKQAPSLPKAQALPNRSVLKTP